MPVRLGGGGIWIPWECQVTTEAPRDGERTWRHTVLMEPTTKPSATSEKMAQMFPRGMDKNGHSCPAQTGSD